MAVGGGGVGKTSRREDALDIRRVKRGREAAAGVGAGAGEGVAGIGEVRILRDADGKIVKVLDGSDTTKQKQGHWAGELQDPLRALESDDEEGDSDMAEDDDDEDDFTSFSDDNEAADNNQDRNGHLQHISSIIGSKTATSKDDENLHSIVSQLTAAAAVPGAKKLRKQSEREAEWCQALVEKHGRDYGAMSRDAKLNVMQQSVGDLKRRVEKYLKSVK